MGGREGSGVAHARNAEERTKEASIPFSPEPQAKMKKNEGSGGEAGEKTADRGYVSHDLTFVRKSTQGKKMMMPFGFTLPRTKEWRRRRRHRCKNFFPPFPSPPILLSLLAYRRIEAKLFLPPPLYCLLPSQKPPSPPSHAVYPIPRLRRSHLALLRPMRQKAHKKGEGTDFIFCFWAPLQREKRSSFCKMMGAIYFWVRSCSAGKNSKKDVF